MKRFQTVCLSLLVLALLEAGSGWAKQGPQSDDPGGRTEVSSQDLKGGFGRPESITGTIVMVKPEQGVLVLALLGPSQPPSTDIIVHTKTVNTGGAMVREEEVTATPAPGETDFNFKVTSSTLIKLDGRQVALGKLATLKGREATVRFVPRRAGNFALGIEVG
jgi:hypothetical protein